MENEYAEFKDIVTVANKYPTLKYQLLSNKAKAPQRGTRLSSGLDVFTPIDFEIPAREFEMISLDLRFEIPEGWDLAVYNKSGVSTKKGLSKGAELIDADYRGSVHIHLFNHTDTLARFKAGDKVAQLVMREVWLGDIEEVEEISLDTERAAGGFGSTGV